MNVQRHFEIETILSCGDDVEVRAPITNEKASKVPHPFRNGAEEWSLTGPRMIHAVVSRHDSADTGAHRSTKRWKIDFVESAFVDLGIGIAAIGFLFVADKMFGGG